MKNTILLLSLLVGFSGLYGCSEEAQNKLSRIGITWLEGDYKITFANGSHTQSWLVKDGKVTSDPEKGYYYFWAVQDNGKKYYVQTPITNSYIEEIKP